MTLFSLKVKVHLDTNDYIFSSLLSLILGT